MTVKNTYSMVRGWQKNPVFRNEIFSRRDAWCWLVENAVWKNSHRTNIKGKIVVLQRGQLSFSIRFMAEAWRWDKARVNRFIKCLKTDTMIETATETGQLVITICNYNRYQPETKEAETATEPPTETGARQERDKEESRNNQDNQGKKNIGTNVPLSEMVELYHQRLPSLAKVRKLTPARKAQIRQRWEKDLGQSVNEWIKFLDRVAASEFLQGANGWRADLEWITKEKNFNKILEGAYDNRKQSNGTKQPDFIDEGQRLIAKYQNASQ